MYIFKSCNKMNIEDLKLIKADNNYCIVWLLFNF